MPSLDDKELDMTSASFFESDTGILLRFHERVRTSIPPPSLSFVRADSR